jgi:hypothetical protein
MWAEGCGPAEPVSPGMYWPWRIVPSSGFIDDTGDWYREANRPTKLWWPWVENWSDFFGRPSIPRVWKPSGHKQTEQR